MRLRQRAWMGIAVILLGLGTMACERAIAPRRSRVAELRENAPAGVGSFYGRVRVLDPAKSCWRSTTTTADVRVEIGLWDGSPAFYRDTLTGAVPTTLDESRFEFIAFTIADKEGRFRFDGLPRGRAYVFRSIPPSDGPWKIGYGASLFGIPTGVELQDFPTLCVLPR